MAARLTELAAELVRGSRRPRVLDYATPEPPPGRRWWRRIVHEVEYWGGGRYLALLALAAAIVLFGQVVGGGLTAFALELMGALLFFCTRAWRVWKDMDL